MILLVMEHEGILVLNFSALLLSHNNLQLDLRFVRQLKHASIRSRAETCTDVISLGEIRNRFPPRMTQSILRFLPWIFTDQKIHQNFLWAKTATNRTDRNQWCSCQSTESSKTSWHQIGHLSVGLRCHWYPDRSGDTCTDRRMPPFHIDSALAIEYARKAVPVVPNSLTWSFGGSLELGGR